MSFNEKLQKLRKQNGLSQEGLADLLDVTRQSVSKWESGTTYPEMDKLLFMCKIFKCSLEDLTNDEIVDIKIEDKKKSNIYTFIDSIIEFIKETIDLLKLMNKKEIESCFVTMGITSIILLLFRFPIIHINNLLDQMIITTTNHFFKFSYHMLHFIVSCSYWSLFLVIFTYIFKSNFLNNPKYKNKIKQEVQPKEELSTHESNPQERVQGKEPVISIKSTTNRIDNLFRFLEHTVMFFLKTLICMIIIPILFLLFFLCAGLFITLYLLFKGVFYISVFIGIPFAILFTLTILEILICFLINRKTSEKRLMITFLVSVIGLGGTFGIFLLDLSSIHFHEEAPIEIEQKTVEFEYEMTDTLYFLYSQMAEYKVDPNLQNTVKVKADYYEDYTELLLAEGSNSSSRPYYGKHDTIWNSQLIPIIIRDLAKRNIYDYSKLNEVNITIYASEENIQKLEQNYQKEMEGMHIREEQYINNSYYEDRIRELEREKRILEEDKQTLNSQVDTLNLQIEEYQNLLNQLKEILE